MDYIFPQQTYYEHQNAALGMDHACTSVDNIPWLRPHSVPSLLRFKT